MTRHPAIVAWHEIIEDEPWSYDGMTETMSRGAAFGRHFGFARLGIHFERLAPGHRSSLPHAESLEDEFVYVLAGHPDVWLDGHLHRLSPGDAVGFPAGEGLAHSFLNNTEADVDLLVVGDVTRPDNQVLLPLHPDRQAALGMGWTNGPARPLGPHDGLTDQERARKG